MARKRDDDGKPEATVAERPPKQGERVAKTIARAGLGSRREAEAWIAAGRVAINGETITSPAVNVTERDAVTIDGQPLPARERTRLYLYHKPRGLVTTNADPQGRGTIFEALPRDLPRLISVGRLDLTTEGLLLLTNDGGLARVLELPETGWLRRYRVRAHGRVTQAQLDALRDGVEIDGVRYGAIEASLDREQGANVWLTFAIREGKNREVRNVLEHLGLAVNRLIRVSFGPFQLGELPEGAVEEVKTRHLREQLGERIAALAGVDFSGPVVEREAAARPRPHPEPPRERPRAGREERRESPRADAAKAAPGRDGRRPSGQRSFAGKARRREGSPGVGRDERREGRRSDFGKGRGERPSAGRGDVRTGRFGADGDRGHRGPPRSFGAPPRRGSEDSRDARAVDTKPKGPQRRSPNSWREDKRPGKRTFHGARREEPREEGGPARAKRSGPIQDRKGRRVLVERVAAQAPQRTSEPRPAFKPKFRPKQGPTTKAPRDRGGRRGPRPSRPR